VCSPCTATDAASHDIFESAFIDGASHFTIFLRLVLPLSIPVLASFAIFQFLCVWNEYLVALIILGLDPTTHVVTMKLSSIVGTVSRIGICSRLAPS
jgi:alpha-glucoside transport system permease protein